MASKFKSYLEKAREKRKESQAFKSIVEKRTLEARRKAYAEEAVVTAKEEGKARARRPSFSSQIGERLRGSVDRKIQGQPTPRAKTVRRIVRRVAVRKSPVKRKVTRRRTAVRYAPRKRTKTRAKTRIVYRDAPKKEEPKPFNIGDIL